MNTQYHTLKFEYKNLIMLTMQQNGHNKEIKISSFNNNTSTALLLTGMTE